MSKSLSSQARVARCDRDLHLLPRGCPVRALTVLAKGRQLLFSTMASAWLIASCQPSAPSSRPSVPPATPGQAGATVSRVAPTQTPERATPASPTAVPTSDAGELDSTCTYGWFLSNPPTECPGEPPRYSVAVVQRFERGMMLWIEEPDFYGSQIYIFYEDGLWPQWDPANDPWHVGWPEDDPSIIPPPGFFQPMRGFGVIWRERSYSGTAIRNRLGWAVEEELSLGEIPLQCIFVDQRPTGCYLEGPEDLIYYVSGPDNSWSVW